MSGELFPDRRELRASHDDRDQVVERLRVAAGDGRLTAEELDERLEAALTARTYGDLERLVVDLPAVPVDLVAGSGAALAPAGAASVTAKEDVQLRTRSGSIRRDGPWAVPRRLDVEARSGNVLLDFTQAVISHPALDITIALRSANLTLIVPTGVSVDVDNVTVRASNVVQRVHHTPGTPISLRITISGNVRSGSVKVRGPRRGLWARLFRRGR